VLGALYISVEVSVTSPAVTRTPLVALASLALMLPACSDDSEESDATSAPTESSGAEAGSESASASATAGGEFACEPGAVEEIGGDLTVYSGRVEELVDPLIECFEELSGVDIEVRYAGSDELALQLAEEGDDTDADVFFSQTSGALGVLEGEGLLAELPAATLDQVADEYRSPTDVWVGASGRVRTFVYNTENVAEDELPATIDDVLTSDWEGRIGVAPSNASFQDFIAAMFLERGEEATAEFLGALVALEPRIEASNVSIVDAVGRGEIDGGLVNHYYGVRALQEDPDLPIANHFFPSGDLGSFVLVAGAGVLQAGADHQEQALAFVDFLLTPVAQQFFASETGEYPIAGDVEPPADLPELGSVGIPGYDEGRLGAAITDAARLIDESGLAEG